MSFPYQAKCNAWEARCSQSEVAASLAQLPQQQGGNKACSGWVEPDLSDKEDIIKVGQEGVRRGSERGQEGGKRGARGSQEGVRRASGGR